MESGPSEQLNILDMFKGKRLLFGKSIEIGGKCTKLHRISDVTIWCVTWSRLFILNKNLAEDKIVKTVAFQHTENPRVVSAFCLNGSEILIGDLNAGVFLLNTDGQARNAIYTGRVSDMCFAGDKLFALDYKGRSIQTVNLDDKVLKINDANGIEREVLKLENYRDSSDADKILVQDDRIYISCWNKGCIFIYDIKGENCRQVGSHGYDVRGSRASLLFCPFICNVGVSGSVVVADCFNHRLQVYQSSDTWGIINLPGDVIYPRDVIIFGDETFWILNARSIREITVNGICNQINN